MIIGEIHDEEATGVFFSPAMKRALSYLRETDFSKLKDGRYEIDGDRIYATVQRYDTKPAWECRPESHRRYTDVQYVAEGQEFIGWCAFTPALKESVPYDEEKLTAYREGNIQAIPDEAFSELLGGPIPDGSWGSNLTENDAICQLGGAKSGLARSLWSCLRRMGNDGPKAFCGEKAGIFRRPGAAAGGGPH